MAIMYERIDVKDELPAEDGKYIVLVWGSNVTEVAFSGSWHCEKVVTHWLKEVNKNN